MAKNLFMWVLSDVIGLNTVHCTEHKLVFIILNWTNNIVVFAVRNIFYVVLILAILFSLIAQLLPFSIIISMKPLPFLHLTALLPMVYWTYRHVWNVSSTNEMAWLKPPNCKICHIILSVALLSLMFGSALGTGWESRGKERTVLSPASAL